jgi:hypothetical protein
VHAAALHELADLVAHPRDSCLVAGDQHHHGELAVEIDHAAVADVTAALDDEGRDVVDQTGTVGSDSGQDDVVDHAADTSPNDGARQR